MITDCTVKRNICDCYQTAVFAQITFKNTCTVINVLSSNSDCWQPTVSTSASIRQMRLDVVSRSFMQKWDWSKCPLYSAMDG